MFPYLIAGAIGYAVAKIFEDDKTPKYSDGGLVVGENDDDNKFPTKEEAFELIQDSIESQGTYFIDEEGDGMFDSEEQAQIYVDEVYDIFDAYYSMEMIPVYRVVEADEVDLDTYSIGESWSMSLDSAKNFGNHLGVSSKKLKIISGYVPSGNVDWESAFKLYVVFSDLGDGDSEFELPIPSNNKIFDVRVSDFKEAKELEPFKFADGGSVLLAPNGKPSNLTPEQYKLVRTPAFKQWFGDWENDRENSGKVSGITKEPVVFYHSTKSNFLSKKGENIFKNPPFFFSFKKDVSDYIVRIQHQNKKGRVYTKPFFLKYHNTFDLRHIKILKDKELTRLIKKHTFYQTESDIRLFELKLSLSKFSGNTWFLTENEDFQDYIKNKGYDSFVVYEDGDKNIAVFNPKQIKLADGTNTTFDGNNPDIRFKNGGELELYHGSEKKFKNFKTNLIDRTDYGWGIYFTDSEDVAKFYARRPFDRDIISQKIIQSKFSTEEKYLLIDTIRLNLLDLEKSKKTLDKKYHPLINQIQKEVQNKSFVYEADVLNEKWLYWDKKVPVDIKRILKNIDDKYFINGETLYNYLTDKLNTQKNASLFLLDKGINGIKYLITNNITDSNIEGYNYVVFDVDDIQIKSISKYADGGQVNFNELIEGYELLLETETDKNKTKIYKEIIEGYELLLDSEFKEPNNNIINEVLWHGSDYDINNFDYNKIIDRSETHLVNFWGYGINFINNENQAKQYGKYLYSVVLSDDADILKGKVKQSQLNKIWDGLIREERIDEKDYEKEKKWFLNHEYSDGDIANDTNEFHSYFLRNKYKLKNSKDVSDFFLRCGIDGMLFDNGIYVIFNDKILNNFKKHYIKGGNSILLAPNGKPSKLTLEQYKLVRLPEFKAWFGDWENDKKNSSKVVDENGEPLVVYHATNNKFWEFSKEKQVVGYYGKGYYFSSSLEVAKDYGKRVIPAFLNIKSVFELSDETPQELLNELAETEVNVIDMGEENTIEQRSKYTFGYASQNSDIFIENLMKSGFYGLRLIYDLEDKIYFFIAFEPNQIKLADGTNTTFDGSNPDIRFDEGGTIDLSYEVPNLDEKITFHEFEYEFKTENNVKYVVQCLIRWREQQDVIRYTDKNGVKKRRLKERADMVLSIAFGTKSRAKDKYGNNNISLRVKNKGEVYRVMATIVKIVKKILKEKTDITFVQFKPMGIDEGDNRRLILYTRAIKKEYPNSLIETGYGEYVLDKKGFENFNRNFFGIKINRKQMKFAKGGSVLLAPNGKPSNLTPEQYKLVRTPEFKAWFGDWENDPANASKVLDENGEPLVVFHGTNNDFYTFDKSKIGLNHRESKSDVYGGGFFFTDKKNKAFRGSIKEVFLKIKKPLLNVIEDKYGYEVDYYHATDTFDLNSISYFQRAKENRNNGIIIKTPRGSLFVAFEPTQIKLADGTNTTFDANNPDIRFAGGGDISKSNKFIGSWEQLKKENPNLWETGILRKNQNPQGATDVIPQDVHIRQGQWQNYGQYDEIEAETIYGKPDSYGYYNDEDGNSIIDERTGNYLKDEFDYENNAERIKATISNKQLKNNLIDSFQTQQGKEYLKKVIATLPKNEDGTITAYRIGTIDEGIQSYTLSEGMAKTFSNQGTDILPSGLPSIPNEGYKEYGVLPVNNVKINPKGIVAWSPYDSEILVESKYVKTHKNKTDIRYKTGGEIKDLIVLHNINAHQIEEANKIGGLVTPSIAIVKAENSFTDFGSITLIGTKELIDPENRSVKVFAGDVYSPSVPRKLYYVDKRLLEKITNELIKKAYQYDDTISKSDREIYHLVYYAIGSHTSFEEDINRMSFNELLDYYYDKLKIVYIVDKGIKIKVPMKEKKHFLFNSLDFTLTPEQKKRFAPILREYTTESNEKGSSGISKEIKSKVYDLFLEVLNNEKSEIKEKYKDQEQADKIYEIMTDGLDESFEKNIGTRYDWYGHSEYNLSRAVYGEQILDTEKFNQNIKKVFTKQVIEDYKKWLSDFISQFRGSAYFLKGNEKVPYTLDNLVDATSNRIVGQEKNMTFGVNQAKSYGTKIFSSINEIKKNSNKLISKDEMNFIDDKNKEVFFKLSESLKYEYSDTWSKLDSLGRALADYFKGTSIVSALRKNDFKTPSSYQIDLFKDFADELKNSPVDYFEAKYQRAVSLREFKYAVVPKETSKEVIQILLENGLIVKKYQSKDERIQIVNSISNKDKSIKFADGGQVNFNELIEGYELLIETETDKNKIKVYKEIIEGYELIQDLNTLSNEGSNSILLAPNGKPSKLTPEQYKLVRTPAFKQWFGDWENDPDNASKVIDKETKEPLVVYHGSRSTVNFAFSEFKIPQEGVFFSSDYGTASWFSEGADMKLHFEKIKKPSNLSEKSSLQELEKYFKENLDNTANVKEIIYDDGTKFYRFNTYSDTSSAPLGNTIKEAQKGLYKKILNNIDYTNSKTTRPFYRVFLNIINPYVINGKGKPFYETPFEDGEYSARSVTSEIKKRDKNDGVIIYDTIEGTDEYYQKVSDSYIAFQPNQIKLADGTNTTFDGSNPDIRFDNGGEITTYTEFYDNLQIEDGSKYIGQKFGEVFPFISRTKTPNDYRIILKEYYGIVKRLEEDNYSTKPMKQRDLNKLKSYKVNIDKKKYLAGFYLSSNGIITKFVK